MLNFTQPVCRYISWCKLNYISDLHCGLIPLGQPCKNIQTKGLKWNLNPEDTLAFGKLVSTSNRFAPGVDKIQIDTKNSLLFTMEVVPTEKRH